MKKYFILFFILTITLSSCRKVVDTMPADTYDAAAQAAEDDIIIRAYLNTNSVTATKDPSGLYYRISNPGTGVHPTLNSGITIAYKLMLVDGTVVETKNSINFQKLGDLVKAWQIGVPLIGKGGVITLYVPSGLAYGNQEGRIPANSVLIFDITLQGFTN